MKIPMVNLVRQYFAIKDEIDKAISEVLASGIYINGSEVSKLENSIASLLDVKHSVAVASGTDALLLSLDALGIGKGDKVAVPGFTFFATAEVVSRLGAIPVFIDVDSSTYNLHINHLEDVINREKDIKAIIPVHLFGQACDMNYIMKLAEMHNLLIIEDACQAINADVDYKGSKRKTGTLGSTGCFSFFPSKNLGCYGDGGMVISNDDKLIEKIRLLRTHGSEKKYYHEFVGYNSRLDAIQAAVLNVKLYYLNEWSEKRRKVASLYNKEFEEQMINNLISYPDAKDGHVFNQYVIQVDRREKLRLFLKQHGVSTAIYYPVPLHLQKPYLNLGYKMGDLPVAENLCSKVLALPIDPELSEEEIKYIVRVIKEFLENDVS